MGKSTCTSMHEEMSSNPQPPPALWEQRQEDNQADWLQPSSRSTERPCLKAIRQTAESVEGEATQHLALACTRVGA